MFNKIQRICIENPLKIDFLYNYNRKAQKNTKCPTVVTHHNFEKDNKQEDEMLG